MANCSSCGNYIPEGQGRSCSMCYGDPYFGKDGYYLQILEEEQKKQMEIQQENDQLNQESKEI